MLKTKRQFTPVITPKIQVFKFGVPNPCGWQSFIPKHVGVTDNRDVVFIVFALNHISLSSKSFLSFRFLQPKRLVHFSSPLFVPLHHFHIYFTGNYHFSQEHI